MRGFVLAIAVSMLVVAAGGQGSKKTSVLNKKAVSFKLVASDPEEGWTIRNYWGMVKIGDRSIEKGDRVLKFDKELQVFEGGRCALERTCYYKVTGVSGLVTANYHVTTFPGGAVVTPKHLTNDPDFDDEVTLSSSGIEVVEDLSGLPLIDASNLLSGRLSRLRISFKGRRTILAGRGTDYTATLMGTDMVQVRVAMDLSNPSDAVRVWQPGATSTMDIVPDKPVTVPLNK